MNEKIILLGAGGHARVLLEIIKANAKYDVEGVLDPGIKKGEIINGIPVLGGDDLLGNLYESGVQNACVSVGSIKDNSTRRKLYEKIKEIGFNLPSFMHPEAVVSGSASIAEGVQVMASAVVQPGVVIGNNTIVNTGAIVEHDCNVGDNVHICPGVVISGGCDIGDDAFIGAKATIINGINIGKKATVAAGAVVVKDVADNALVKGVPAR